MTTTHAIAIAVPLWALATVAVVRFMRYAKSDDCLTCLHNEEQAKVRLVKDACVPPSNPKPAGAIKPPPPASPPPIPAPEWPLRRAQLLALAHKWRERADEASRAGDSIRRDMLDQCAMSLEREVRA